MSHRPSHLTLALALLTFACAEAEPPDANEDATLDASREGLDAAPLDLGATDAGLGEPDADAPDLDEPDAAAPDLGEPDAEPLDLGGPDATDAGAPACGENAHVDLEHEACVCDDGFIGDPTIGCTPRPAATGFVGSACGSAASCDLAQAECRADGEGWPDGHCTTPCTRLCPDREGHPVTFCVDAPAIGPRCVSRCDTALFPGTGCRPGYACRALPRAGEPDVVRSACVPAGWSMPTPTCADPANPGFDDDCYLDLVAFGDPSARALARAILGGTASPADAEAWLDRNHAASTAFILDELASTIHDNATAGHRGDRPMRGMIVHYTANQREDATIRYFVGASPHASTHFVIGSHRNGLVVQLFSHRDRTWHAGSTYNVDRFGLDFANAGYLEARADGTHADYAGRTYTMNLPPWGTSPITVTGGIPGAGSKYGRRTLWQPYTVYQLLSFVLVTRALDLTYGLERAAIERHGDVADSRVDPGPALPLTALLDLAESSRDAFAEPWLLAYRVEPDWIERHPEAR